MPILISSQRKRRSGGQALVLITLSLIAMCGIMGLAVDLGWSYFVQKEAQAAADAGALAAAQEAYARLSGSSIASFTCPGSPSGATDIYCQTVPVNCGTFTASSTSNLSNGCLYVQQNGFTSGGLGGRQMVTIEANDGQPGHLPGTQPTDIAYWVRVRVSQTVPQLFSSVLSNTQGTVSAAAVAAIASSVVPGSFYALNHRYDCITTGKAPFSDLCGVDVDIAGSGKNNLCPGTSGNGTLCADAGIVLASTCNGTSQIGCGTNGPTSSGSNFAGQTQNGANVYSSQAIVYTGGAVNRPNNWTPPPTQSGSASILQDPTQGKPQPPLALPTTGTLPTCGIPGGVISNGGNTPLVMGPYQYFSYHTGTTGAIIPDGNPIKLQGNVQFSTSGGCSLPGPGALPSGVPAPLSAQFPAYLFWGGLDISNTGNINLGPGQYILAGANSATNTILNLGGGNATITGDTVYGTQFIATAPGYPGLDAQEIATHGYSGGLYFNAPLFQGSLNLQAGNSGSAQLTGIVRNSLPAQVSFLGDYGDSIIWSDRRNSTVVYDQTSSYTSFTSCSPCTGSDDGEVVADGTYSSIDSIRTANGVRAMSPMLSYTAGVNLNLSGNIYQPRGAWLFYQGAPNQSASLQIITGMIEMGGGGQVSLLPNAAPLTKYVVTLIQ